MQRGDGHAELIDGGRVDLIEGDGHAVVAGLLDTGDVGSGVTGLDTDGGIVSVDAVSYTHLDVYKRQIFLTMAMGAVLKGKEKTPAVAAAAPAAAAPAPTPQGMQPEILAAITAALSEEIGIPSRSMNIVNIKKI